MDIIRAWKDEEYRLSLTEEQRALLPDNPAGHQIELSDADLESVAGGISVWGGCSVGGECENNPGKGGSLLLCEGSALS